MKKSYPINFSAAAFRRLAGRVSLLGQRRHLVNRLMDWELQGSSQRAEVLCLWLMLERTAPDIANFREVWKLSGLKRFDA